MRLQRRRASPFDGRQSPASSRRKMNLSTSTGCLQREKTSIPIFGNTPFSPRSIFTATLPGSSHGCIAFVSACVSPCQPIAASPPGISSHDGNMITSRMMDSSRLAVMVPTCLINAPFGSLWITWSSGARSFFARSLPKKGGRNSSHAASSSGPKPVFANRQGVIMPPSAYACMICA